MKFANNVRHYGIYSKIELYDGATEEVTSIKRIVLYFLLFATISFATFFDTTFVLLYPIHIFLMTPNYFYIKVPKKTSRYKKYYVENNTETVMRNGRDYAKAWRRAAERSDGYAYSPYIMDSLIDYENKYMHNFRRE